MLKSDFVSRVSDAIGQIPKNDTWVKTLSGESFDIRWTRPLTSCDELCQFMDFTDVSTHPDNVIASWSIGITGRIALEFERFFSTKYAHIQSNVRLQDFSEHYIYRVTLQWLSMALDRSMVVADLFEPSGLCGYSIDISKFNFFYACALQHFKKFSTVDEIAQLLSDPDFIRSPSPAPGVTCLDNTTYVSLIYVADGAHDKGIKILNDSLHGKYLPAAVADLERGSITTSYIRTRALACLEFVTDHWNGAASPP